MSKDKLEKFHWGMQALRGARASKEEAARLETRISANPSDNEARAALIGYYSNGRLKSKSAARNRNRHILWILENAPDCGLGTTPCLHIVRSEHPTDYEKSKALIVSQCEEFKNDPDVLMDLGSVLRYEEPELTIQILRRAHTLTSDKADVAFWLAHALHRLGQQDNDLDHLRDAVSFMQEFVAADKPSRNFDNRYWLAKFAFDGEQFDLARDVSNQMLSDNPENHQAVHVAHIVLGSIAFKKGDIATATEHLLLAGKVGHSPRLGSYGPMMKLAQNVLESGGRDAVLQYLTDCKKFWGMGKRKLPKWIRQIAAGENPDLHGDDW